MVYNIGVDLGGTNIAVGLVDAQHNILARTTAKTNLPRPREQVEFDIAKLCQSVCSTAGVGLASVNSIGIGCPGSVDGKNGFIEFNANFQYRNWALAQAVKTLLAKPVYIENDANTAAFGEFLAGGTKGYKNSIFVTVGTGVGGGIIVDGHLLIGHNFAAGEIGHMVIVKDGLPCLCGRKGCFEKYASTRALAEHTKNLMTNNPGSDLWQYFNTIETVNAKTVFEAHKAGSLHAKEIIDEFYEYIACGLTNLINIFQPQVICIGGGLSREGQSIIPPIKAIIDKEEFTRNNKTRTEVLLAKLQNDAGIIGAAFLHTNFQREI